MGSSGWDTAAEVSDTLSAHALAGLFASEGVPARIQSDTELLGVVRRCRILVPARLINRAKCVLWQSRFTEEELASIAAGTAPEEPP